MADVNIKYKGVSIATMDSSGAKKLNTSGKYCEGDIVIEYTDPEKPTQVKSATPSEAEQDITPDSGKVLSKVSIGAIPKSYVGSGITRKEAQTYMPGTANQSIAAGQYLNGVQTVKGDVNLKPENIKDGVSIFGKVGTHKGGITPSGTKAITANGTYDVTEFANVSVDVPSEQINARIYTLTLQKSSGWILLTTLDADVISHMNDDSLSVVLYNISPYQYVHYSGRAFFAGNTPVGKINQYPVYGYAGRVQSETSISITPIYYKPFDTTTDVGLGGAGRFRYSGGKFYIRPGDGFVDPGTYRLMFAW